MAASATDPTKPRLGRPPGSHPESNMLYDRPKVQAEILARIAAGEPLEQICRDEHLPCVREVHQWRTDDPVNFGAGYARAREEGYDAIAADALRIADESSRDVGEDGKVNTEIVQRSKLRVETRLRLLACWSKRYNPQADHQTTIQVGVQVGQLTDERRMELIRKKRLANS